MFRFPSRALVLNLKTVFAAGTILLSLLGIGAWGVMSLLDRFDTLHRAEERVGEAARLLGGHVETVLEGASTTLLRLAILTERERGIEILERPSVKAILAAGQFGALSAIGPDGRTLVGAPPPLAPADMQALFDPTSEPLTVITTAPAGGRTAVILARALRGPSGATEGAVLLALPPDALSSVVGNLNMGPDVTAGLFRPDGRRLAGDGSATLGPLPALAAGEEAVLRDRVLDGRTVLVGLKQIRTVPVTVAVAVPHMTILISWHTRLLRGLGLVLLGLVALGAIAWVGFGSLRREEQVRRALTDANAQLEQRVEDRTADLRSLNHKLVRALAEKERANQAKARFLSAANHDLRQPFQALRLFHHLLMERLSDPRDRSIGEKMGQALDSGENLLHALLEVATLDAGVVRPEVADVPIGPVLETVAAEFRAAAEEKGLEFRVLPCDATVRTDRALFTRMLRDLLRNAVSYTRQGRIMLGCRRRGQWLRVEVWDTGSGIPAEHLDAIFEDFVQLGNPERDSRHGLGLGLAKVRRKAALLGHALEVRSRYGQGSVFSITVPVSGAERRGEESATASGAAADPAAPRLILVVEDDPVQRSGVAMLLESWGHQVMAAADGGAALDLLRASGKRPDVVVTDFRLPGTLNGVQVIRRVAEMTGGPVPAIVMTGDTAAERIREAVAAGCRLLHKPYPPAQLQEALAALSGGPPGRPLHRQTAA